MAGLIRTIQEGQYIPPSTTVTTVLREQLLEMVSIIDPSNTPVIDILPKVEVDSPVVQWITDVLPALVLNNTAGSVDILGINVQGISEGFDNPSFDSNYPYSTTNPRRQTNFVQIWAGKVGISDTLGRGKPAGIRNPYQHETLKVTRAVGKAMERRWLGNKEANASFIAGGETGAVRTMKKLAEWGNSTSDGASASPIMAYVNVGGLLTADNVDTGAETAHDNGGEPDYLVVGTGSKTDLVNDLRMLGTANALQPINQSTIQAAERRIIKAVDIYEGTHGAYAVLSSRQMPQSNATTANGGAGRAYLLQRDLLAWGTFVPVHHIPLAKTGYNTKGIIVGEGTTIVRNAAAFVEFGNVTT